MNFSKEVGGGSQITEMNICHVNVDRGYDVLIGYLPPLLFPQPPIKCVLQ